MAIRDWLHHVWPMGGVLTASLAIAWATEVLAFFLSRGLAFAVLAFLQVLPEFAVEAVITISAGKDPAQLQYVTANFTGANRLIIGLFIPMTFYIAALRSRRQGKRLTAVELPATSSIEVVFLIIATLYSLLIPLKGTLNFVDAAILFVIYFVYLTVVQRLPPESETHAELPLVPRTIRAWPTVRQKLAVIALFLVGAALLFFSVEPFYHNTLELGFILGINSYFLLQWLAPFLSEFPEFITILYWGRTGRAQLGLTNAISSKINQWTLLIAMLPLAYAYGTSTVGAISWSLPLHDDTHRIEILLTAMQGLFAAFVLLDLRLDRWQAHALLLLWAIQLLDPVFDPLIHQYAPSLAISPLGSGAIIREWSIFAYFLLSIYLLYYHRGHFEGLTQFVHVWKVHVARRRPVPVSETPLGDKEA